jgi:predicted nuclease of predicted toxin-antitoxin system
MLPLYADEQFPFPVVKRLRAKGYDILTVQDAGNANQRISDESVLAFATEQGRAVITQNRRHFIALHNQGIQHQGIVVCSKNLDWDGFTVEIDRILNPLECIAGELVRVNRPSQSCNNL